MWLDSDDVIRKRVAREILSMIETVCFSEEFSEYRVNNGSNGERDLIMKILKRRMKLDKILVLCGAKGEINER